MTRETPKEFDGIRCYEPKDYDEVFERLLADEAFCSLVLQLLGGISRTELKQMLYACKDSLTFQKTFTYSFIQKVIATATDGISMDASALPHKNGAYTFISNHRDIVLDPAFLGISLLDNGFHDTQEIAIGDNLLVYPWIEHLVRLNKAFIVRRGVGFRETLLAGQLMSRYMHYVLTSKKNSVWIAQREGRAKDSNDKTQEAVLKMIAMGQKGNVVDSLMEMNITPLSLSYEYDPCDYLKAREFQMKRDDETFKKTPADDLLNMKTGIMGYKGRVRFVAAPTINAWLEEQRDLSKNELFAAVAQHIDENIYQRYTFYPNNYVAADLLEKTDKRNEHYSVADQQKFQTYIAQQIARIELPHKDEAYLRTKMYEMYANPLLNSEALAASKTD